MEKTDQGICFVGSPFNRTLQANSNDEMIKQDALEGINNCHKSSIYVELQSKKTFDEIPDFSNKNFEEIFFEGVNFRKFDATRLPKSIKHIAFSNSSKINFQGGKCLPNLKDVEFFKSKDNTMDNYLPELLNILDNVGIDTHVIINPNNFVLSI